MGELEKKMIITRLMGGLGNQMFQYAAAKCLAAKRGAPLKLDVSLYGTSQEGLTPRRFELGCFALDYDIASEQDISLARNGRGFKYIREGAPGFERAFFKFPDNAYLDGYCQSERYFKNIEKVIREDFIFRGSQRGVNKELAEKILSAGSVSVHIRRTDYVSDPKINVHHGICGLEYYLAAVSEIGSKVKDPYFFVFADDIDWAKQNFKVKHQVEYIAHNRDENSFEDMRLMSQCRHNIIANSTFSWWGAWLNVNPGKIVVAPKKWFRDGETGKNEIVPKEWIKL